MSLVPHGRLGPTAFQSIRRNPQSWVLGWNVNPSVPSSPCPSRAAAEWAALGLQVPRTAFDGYEVSSRASHGDGCAQTS